MIGRGASHDAEALDAAWTSSSTSSESPDLDPQTAHLLRTIELLGRSAVVEPTEQFRTDLRDRLMAEAADVLVAPARPAPAAPAEAPNRSPRRRRLATLTAAIVAGTATFGMVSASASAVPGDVLYPVKRGVESVQLALHRDDASRGQAELDQAAERLQEAWSLDDTGRDDQVAGALEAFSDQATAGSDLLFAAYAEDDSAQQIEAVNDFAAESTTTILDMSDDLPGAARVALDEAADTVIALAARASALCTSCSPADLGSLLSAPEAVDTGSDSPDSTKQPAADEPAPKPTSPASPAPRSTAAPTSPAPAPAPSPKAPAPSAAPKTPELRDVTDPLLGPLLGNDEQPGLVPSLLDGLLGGGTTK
jgi:hypothetical protein